MIGPIGAIRVQRSAPAARVARKAKTRVDLMAFDVTEPSLRRPDRAEAEPEDDGSLTGSGRKVSPAVLAALLKLKRGG